ncbi:MAG: hypothetical protein RR211_07160 [Pseudoflavonifractor sp.]
MSLFLSQVITQQGLSILSDPKKLRDSLVSAGEAPVTAATMELILLSCPFVASTLAQGELCQAEANVLLSRVVQTTALAPATAWKLLLDLMTASGISIKWPAKSLNGLIKKADYPASIPDAQEGAILRVAQQHLKAGIDPAAALSILDRLAQTGNAYANYYLGDYFHQIDLAEGSNKGEEYFRLAAELGYGPAYGGLADCALNCSPKNLQKAATYLEYPTALVGYDGKTWAQNAAKLLDYRGKNRKRGRDLLFLTGLSLLLSLAVLPLGSIAGLPALLLSLAALGRTVYSLLWSQYSSHRSTYYAVLACWLLCVLALL